MPHEADSHGTVLSKERVKRRAPYLLLSLLLCLATPFAETPASAAQQKPGRTSVVIDSDAKFVALAESQRLRILIQMIRAGRHDLADRLINTYPFRGKHAENRTLFIEGMILKARGNYKGAIGNFRRALASDPNLSLVRMELAHTLYLTEQDSGAKHHLELLRSSAPSVDTARQFDRFIDAVDARDPWSLDAYFSLAPSTNFNNGTSEQIVFINGLPFQISSNSREKSGLGVRGGVNASYTLRTGKGVDLIAGGGLNFTEYGGNTFDDQILSQIISVRKHTKNGTVTGSILATERWSGTDEFTWTIGPQLTLHQQLAPGITMFSKLRHSIIDYKQADYRSGHKTLLDHRLSYSFADGTVGYLLTGGERSVSKRKFNDYWAVSGGLGLYHEAPYGINIYAEAQLQQKWFEGTYPIINEAREDTKVEVNVSFAKRDFEIYGLTPRLHYSYIHNFSNSPLDTYDSHGANLTLTRQF